MKKSLLISLAMLAMTLSVPAAAQDEKPQIPNSDFESWNGGNSNHAPDNWNSFETATGTLASMVKYQQVEQSTDVRPGSTGNYSARIYSRAVKVLGVTLAVAQGNLTLGRINAGATTASNKANHNFSDISDPAFSQTLGRLPDSLVVWVKYAPAKPDENPKARVSATVHDAYNYIVYGTDSDDKDDTDNAAHAVAHATMNIAPEKVDGQFQWKRLAIPFSTSGCTATSPDYIIVNFATNATPGAGAEGDELYIDDLELVYNDGQTGPEPSVDLANFLSTEYEGALLVSINDQLVSASKEKVTLEINDQKHNSINFALNNFILGAGTDEPMYVGTIRIDDIQLEGTVDHITFVSDDPVQVQPGTDPADAFWMGPLLGPIPVNIIGDVQGEHFLVVIDINLAAMNQSIHVVFDTDDSVLTAIEGVEPSKFSDGAIYDLQGRKLKNSIPQELKNSKTQELTNLPKGVYIINGKKVLVK